MNKLSTCKSKSVSVVSFITGRGEDRTVHIVRAFTSEVAATTYCSQMNDALRAYSLHFESKNVPDYEQREAFGIKLGHIIHTTGGMFVCKVCPLV